MCVCKGRRCEINKGEGMRERVVGVCEERARASHVRDPWRLRTSGERRSRGGRETIGGSGGGEERAIGSEKRGREEGTWLVVINQARLR